MASFFPIFFKEYWTAGTDPVVSTAKLGLANSAAGILVALMAPALGAIADRGAAKKNFLLFFAALGIAATASLYWVPRGSWQAAAACYVLAMMGFAGSIVFYDSLLTTVAAEPRRDFVSSLGFSMGYLGGGVLFALNVWMTLSPATFGLPGSGEGVKLSFLSVSLWWALFSVPLVFLVRERGVSPSPSPGAAVREGLAQLRDTFRRIRSLRTIFLFLAAYWLYIDGVDTIIVMALDYGLSIGFKADDLIVALLITQFIGFPSALAFGRLGERIGAKRAILIGIAVYLAITVYGAFIDEPREFYILAGMIGLVQGGVQALSRSLYSRIIPAEQSAEFFGFYNMLSRFASVAGPVLIGATGIWARSMGYEGSAASRIGIVSVALLFLAGGFALSRVDEARGKREAALLTRR
ncbi:MAG: Vacuole effluxer Atg22 like protein [Syntrophaceae bacterium PtaB.Bin038]|nr:MAG: Vacuole effluxer Atg22 like protein [Syntrophaceae bacterium PtaB.Bin038]